MRFNFFLALILTIGLQASATETLLDCNLAQGPDQHVTVLKQDNQLLLRELTNVGATVERVLTSKEWANKSFSLRDSSFGQKTNMHRVSDGWMYHVKGPGLEILGYADCF